MRTRARKVGNEYVINGEKMWITSGSIADVAVIWAKVENEERQGSWIPGRDRPSWILSGRHPRQVVTACIGHFRVFPAGCACPGGNLLPGSGGLKSPLMCLNQARYGIAWGAIGAAMSCYDTCAAIFPAAQAVARHPIACHQLVQEKADLDDQRNHERTAARAAGRAAERRGQSQLEHISMAKRNNVWMALECARTGARHSGRERIADDYPVMRH